MSRLAIWLQPGTLSKPNNVTSQTRLVAAQNRPQIREGSEIGSSDRRCTVSLDTIHKWLIGYTLRLSDKPLYQKRCKR